jgi:hypothetical protein
MVFSVHFVMSVALAKVLLLTVDQQINIATMIYPYCQEGLVQ